MIRVKASLMISQVQRTLNLYIRAVSSMVRLGVVFNDYL